MGGHNTNAPDVLGMEDRWTEGHTDRLTNGVAYMQRVRGDGKAWSKLHSYNERLNGSRPGLALEVISGEPMPEVGNADFFPGADVTTTGWENNDNTTTNLWQRVDDRYDLSDYVRNNGVIVPGERRRLLFRGNISALTNVRIPLVALTIHANFFQFRDTLSATVRGGVRLGGTWYPGDDHYWPNEFGGWHFPFALSGAAWSLNPSTKQPWTLTEVNNLVSTTATDAFGIDVTPTPDGYYAVDNEAFNVAGVLLWVLTLPENRARQVYISTKPRDGWDGYALSSNFTPTNNTYYWLIKYGLNPAPGAEVVTPSLSDAHGDFALADNASDTTGEHRHLLAAALAHNIPTATLPPRERPVTDGQPGTVMPFLIEATRTVADGVTTVSSPNISSATAAFSLADIGSPITGTNIPAGTVIASVASATAAVMSQNATASGTALTFNINSIVDTSNPYVRLEYRTLHSAAPANIGQKLTPQANKDYAAVILTAGWGSFNLPDRPLEVKVNSAIDGSGTTFAIATIFPDDPEKSVTDRQVTLKHPTTGADTTVSGVAGTPLYVLVSSQAQADRPWRIIRYDTRSDRRLAGALTTQNQIEAASLGAGLAINNHTYVEAGSALTRYDLAVALVAAPDPPTGFSATPEAAV